MQVLRGIFSELERRFYAAAQASTTAASSTIKSPEPSRKTVLRRARSLRPFSRPPALTTQRELLLPRADLSTINNAFFGAAGLPSIVYFAPDSRLPQIDQFDMVVEHEIARNTVVSVSWLGTYGRYLPLSIDTNAPPQNGSILETIGGTLPTFNNSSIQAQLPRSAPPSWFRSIRGEPQARPNKSFQTMAELSTSAKSWYNASVVQLTRRMQHGLQVQASYTWAHAIDTDQTLRRFSPAARRWLRQHCSGSWQLHLRCSPPFPGLGHLSTAVLRRWQLQQDRSLDFVRLNDRSRSNHRYRTAFLRRC